MTNSDQTFRKQRLEEGSKVEDCYGIGNQPATFLDLHDDSIFENEYHFQNEAVTNQEVDRSEVTIYDTLQRRIRELETIVYLRNRELQKSKVLERDFEEALITIAKRDAEIKLLRDSREKYYNEHVFYERQAAAKTQQCENYEERIRELNLHRVEDMQKIRELEEKVNFYKEKCEPDITQRKVLLGYRLVQKHEETPTDSGIGHEPNASPPKRRRHFRKSLTSLPKCRNCQTVFDQLRPHEITCTFHRALPQPLKAWKSQMNLADLQLDKMDLNGYMFWPCCEKYGLKEPPGCLKLKSHEIISPDEE